MSERILTLITFTLIMTGLGCGNSQSGSPTSSPQTKQASLPPPPPPANMEEGVKKVADTLKEAEEKAEEKKKEVVKLLEDYLKSIPQKKLEEVLSAVKAEKDKQLEFMGQVEEGVKKLLRDRGFPVPIPSAGPTTPSPATSPASPPTPATGTGIPPSPVPTSTPAAVPIPAPAGTRATRVPTSGSTPPTR